MPGRSRRGGDPTRGLSRVERDVWGGREGFAHGSAVGWEVCPSCLDRGALHAKDGRPISLALVAGCEDCGGVGSVRRPARDPYKTVFAA